MPLDRLIAAAQPDTFVRRTGRQVASVTLCVRNRAKMKRAIRASKEDVRAESSKEFLPGPSRLVFWDHKELVRHSRMGGNSLSNRVLLARCRYAATFGRRPSRRRRSGRLIFFTGKHPSEHAMFKSLCAAAIMASTLSIGPAFAATTEDGATQSAQLTFAAMMMHKMRPLPWCSRHIRHHCRPHHIMMMNKKM